MPGNLVFLSWTLVFVFCRGVAAPCHEERQAGACSLGSLPGQVSRDGRNTTVHVLVEISPRYWHYLKKHIIKITLNYFIFVFTELLITVFNSLSYDTWVSASELDGDPEDPPSTDRPWKVSRLQPTGVVLLLKKNQMLYFVCFLFIVTIVCICHVLIRQRGFTTSAKQFPFVHFSCHLSQNILLVL